MLQVLGDLWATNQRGTAVDLLAAPSAFDEVGQILCQADDTECQNQGAKSNITGPGSGADISGGRGGGITQGILAAVVIVAVLVPVGFAVMTCCSSVARRKLLFHSLTACICPCSSLAKKKSGPSAGRKRQPRLLPKDALQFHDDLVASKRAFLEHNLSCNVAAVQHESLHISTQYAGGNVLVGGDFVNGAVEQKFQQGGMWPVHDDISGEVVNPRPVPVHTLPLPEPFWTVKQINWPTFPANSANTTISSPKPSPSILDISSPGNEFSATQSRMARMSMSPPISMYFVEQAATHAAAAANSAAANSTVFGHDHLQQHPTALDTQGAAAGNSGLVHASELVQPLVGAAAAYKLKEFSPLPGVKLPCEQQRLKTPLESLLAKATLAGIYSPSGSPVAVTRTSMSAAHCSPMTALAGEHLPVEGAYNSRKNTAWTGSGAASAQQHGGSTLRLVKGPSPNIVPSQYPARPLSYGRVLPTAVTYSSRNRPGGSDSIVADLVIVNSSLPAKRISTGCISDDLFTGSGV